MKVNEHERLNIYCMIIKTIASSNIHLVGGGGELNHFTDICWFFYLNVIDIIFPL